MMPMQESKKINEDKIIREFSKALNINLKLIKGSTEGSMSLLFANK